MNFYSPMYLLIARAFHSVYWSGSTSDVKLIEVLCKLILLLPGFVNNIFKSFLF